MYVLYEEEEALCRSNVYSEKINVKPQGVSHGSETTLAPSYDVLSFAHLSF